MEAGFPKATVAPVASQRATEWLMLTSSTSGMPKVVIILARKDA
jgi:hypothetical protein